MRKIPRTNGKFSQMGRTALTRVGMVMTALAMRSPHSADRLAFGIALTCFGECAKR